MLETHEQIMYSTWTVFFFSESIFVLILFLYFS